MCIKVKYNPDNLEAINASKTIRGIDPSDQLVHVNTDNVQKMQAGVCIQW